MNIIVMGMGKVGQLVGHMLHDTNFNVTGVDTDEKKFAFKTINLNVTDKNAVIAELKKNDAVVSCLPYNLNIDLSTWAHEAGIHYFDLTEDVTTTNHIRNLAKTSKGVMAPQCGLAPGFIGIVGADLSTRFETLRSVELRVGALPQHPRGKLGYAFNWSAEGVVNEYLNACEVIKNGERAVVPALEGLETIVIDGNELESFTTSGGLGTMCETFEGQVRELNYKTMRYPGHCALMRFFFHELHMQDNRQQAGDILVNAKPPVNDDVVYVHAAIEGQQKGQMFREEFVEAYYPQEICGKEQRAISWTTAASICAVIEMVKKGVLPSKGFIKQEDISLKEFFKTKNGGYYTKGANLQK
ncbi:MAG: saccharopine dehydrogenase-like NADP-dependent oxidoreductase [Alphaproteobacteria bacterium]|jgi:saccharopine dehydrogenase-like NADP-dependent oxidoreductase